jgi:hypothetical protein
MTEALEREDRAVSLILTGKGEKGSSILNSAHPLFQEGLKIAKNNVTVPGEQAYIDDIRLKYINYEQLWRALVPPHENETDLVWNFQDVLKALLEVKGSVEKLMTLNNETM